MADTRLASLSLCSGIGGIELALAEWARPVCYVERDAYAAAVLLARMEEKALEPAPIWCGDLRDFPARELSGVDLVTAGFPCQPFSTAKRGRRRSRDLWPDIWHIVAAVKPSIVFLENVQQKALSAAGVGLADLGFRCMATRVAASCLGAAHRRPRWWFLAFTDDARKPAFPVDDEVASLPAAAQADEWAQGPGAVLGMDVRIPDRVDRLRCLGNAVVPQQARLAWCELWQKERP